MGVGDDRSDVMHALHALLAPTATRLGVALQPLLPPMCAYAQLLLQWNQRINLTGARDLETLAREHLADALALVPLLPAAPARWIDVGTGAGLPGVVLAIARPDLQGVLLEPREKRRSFLSSAIRTLRLERVSVIGDRVLDHAAGAGAAGYDLAVSRAVLPLQDWLSVGRGLIKPGGVLLGLEGSTPVPLPLGAERLPYDIGLGPRAIIRVVCR